MSLSSQEQGYDREHEECHQVDGDRQGDRLCGAKKGFNEECVCDVDGDECYDDQKIAVQTWSCGDMFGEDEVDAAYHDQDSCVVCQCCWFVEEDD